MPAVKTRVLTAGLYLKKNELRLEIVKLQATFRVIGRASDYQINLKLGQWNRSNGIGTPPPPNMLTPVLIRIL